MSKNTPTTLDAILSEFEATTLPDRGVWWTVATHSTGALVRWNPWGRYLTVVGVKASEHYTTPIAVGVDAHGWARLDERVLADDGVTYAVETWARYPNGAHGSVVAWFPLPTDGWNHAAEV